MTIVFADPTATLAAAGVLADRPARRASTPRRRAAVEAAGARPGAVRHGLSSALVRVARTLDPSLEQRLVGAR